MRSKTAMCLRLLIRYDFRLASLENRVATVLLTSTSCGRSSCVTLFESHVLCREQTLIILLLSVSVSLPRLSRWLTVAVAISSQGYKRQSLKLWHCSVQRLGSHPTPWIFSPCMFRHASYLVWSVVVSRQILIVLVVLCVNSVRSHCRSYVRTEN